VHHRLTAGALSVLDVLDPLVSQATGVRS